MSVNTLSGIFSVSDTRKVVFTKGNLLYQASTNTWRMADHQYDCVGGDSTAGGIWNGPPMNKYSPNNEPSAEQVGWIDMFAWGTSNLNTGAVEWQPWAASINTADYNPGGDLECDIQQLGTERADGIVGKHIPEGDWAYAHNSELGGDADNPFRVLTYSEWKYLLENRSDGRQMHAYGKVGEMPGLFLLPDNWKDPAPNGQALILGGRCAFYQNHYSLEAWEVLEDSGLVFLPAAGSRTGHKMFFSGHYGGYWTSSRVNDTDAYRMFFFEAFGGNFPSVDVHTRWGAFAIRAVQEVK